MKKDGTRYLALIKWPTQTHWEIIHWGTPIGLSNPHNTQGWINQIGFQIRTDNSEILEHHELEQTIQTIKKQNHQ